MLTVRLDDVSLDSETVWRPLDEARITEIEQNIMEGSCLASPIELPVLIGKLGGQCFDAKACKLFNIHVANFLYCWPVEPQLTKGMHHSPHLVLFRMLMVCRIGDVLFSRRLAMPPLHLHSFHITAFPTSLLLVLAGGTAACHVCFRPLACKWCVGSCMFCSVGGLQCRPFICFPFTLPHFQPHFF